MIRRKNNHSLATQYAVIIGWDSWLQPLVFAISKNSDQTGVDFRILTDLPSCIFTKGLILRRKLIL
jgi:hypothetical protein